MAQFETLLVEQSFGTDNNEEYSKICTRLDKTDLYW